MKPVSWWGRIIAAVLFATAFAVQNWLEQLKWHRLGSADFLRHETHRYERLFDHPSPLHAIALFFILLGSVCCYELVAWVLDRTLVRANR